MGGGILGGEGIEILSRLLRGERVPVGVQDRVVHRTGVAPRNAAVPATVSPDDHHTGGEPKEEDAVAPTFFGLSIRFDRRPEEDFQSGGSFREPEKRNLKGREMGIELER